MESLYYLFKWVNFKLLSWVTFRLSYTDDEVSILILMDLQLWPIRYKGNDFTLM